MKLAAAARPDLDSLPTHTGGGRPEGSGISPPR